MKAERGVAKFEPVIITLESQREVDLICDLLALAAETPDLEYACEMFRVVGDYSTDKNTWAILKEHQTLKLKK